jgi:uncharacterized protein involved in outer membrane biogenesis
MKTLLKLSLLGALVVLLAGYFVAAYFMGSLVKTGVNQVGPRITQSKVELAAAHLSPLTGAGTLEGLAVGNPAGWSERNAFFLGRVTLNVEPMSLFKDTIVINEITIDQPEFLYETRLISSNIKDLLKNIEQSTGSRKETTAAAEGPPKKYILKKFRLTNGRATLGIGTSAIPVTLPPLSLDDLGVAEGGLTSGQLAGAIMKRVLSDIVTVAASGNSPLEKTKEAAKQAGEAIKNLFRKP